MRVAFRVWSEASGVRGVLAVEAQCAVPRHADIYRGKVGEQWPAVGRVARRGSRIVSGVGRAVEMARVALRLPAEQRPSGQFVLCENLLIGMSQRRIEARREGAHF